MSRSNSCFLTHIQVFQETGKVICYCYFLKLCTQFDVIHTVKGFSIVNEGEVHGFLEFPCSPHGPTNVDNLISGSSASLKPDCTPGSSQFTYCDVELFALEANKNHFVIFKVAPKVCILDSFVDYVGYSLSSIDCCPQW